jgi:hypothetical protein
MKANPAILFGMKEPLKPLIPLDDLRRVLTQIVQVPKDAVTERDSPKPSKPAKDGESNLL